MLSKEYNRLQIDYIKYQLSRLPEVKMATTTYHGVQHLIVYVREGGKIRRYRASSKLGKKYSAIADIRRRLETDLDRIMCDANIEQKSYVFPIVQQGRFQNGKVLWDSLKATADSNTYYPKPANGPVYKGVIMRSKSELTVAMTLDELRFPYVYEPQLIVNGRELYPDFAIYVRELNKVIFIEYFGKMDQRGYVTTNVNKMCDYADAGFVEGLDIIYIQETQHAGINTRVFKEKINAAIMSNLP